MSYAHQKHLTQAVAQTFSAGIKKTYSPGVTPQKLRSVAIVITTQMTVTPPVLSVKHRPTAGSAAGETVKTTLTVPLARLPGEVVYRKNLDILVKPGENIVFDVTVAATAGAADIVAEWEPVWELLNNNPKAFASA